MEFAVTYSYEFGATSPKVVKPDVLFKPVMKEVRNLFHSKNIVEKKALNSSIQSGATPCKQRAHASETPKT